jgi:hypothetical protein
MPDITMCTGVGCPRAQICYRKVATPSMLLQSYFVTPPFNKDSPTECTFFWRVEEED